MNKLSRSILIFCLVTITVLASGCGAVTAVPAPTGTPVPSLTPTETMTAMPSPTNTSEPIHSEGVLVYLNSGNVITTNLQSQETKSIFIPKAFYHNLVVGNDIYVPRVTGESYHHSELVSVNLDGTNIEKLLPLTDKYSPLDCGILSPNKRYLLCYYGKGIGSILVIDTETKSVQPIPAEDDHQFRSVSWSPDGQKIYFLDTVNLHSINGVLVTGVHEKGRLLEFSLGTNKLSELLPEISKPDVRWGDQDQIAGWSPSRIHLLVNLACNSNSTDIIDHPYIFNANSKSIKQIKVDGCVAHFRWSPDGTKLALTMFDKNAHSDLFIYDVASEGIHKIPANGQQVFYFAWSPNGKYILFSVYSFQDPRNGIYLLNVPDGSVVQVMPNKKYSYTYQADDFTWSPDGNMVLFRQWAPDVNGLDLYLLNADTKTVDLVERQILDTWYFHQMWAPDGKYFIFIGGTPTRKFKIQSAYSGEQIEIKVPIEVQPYTQHIYWIINNSVYHSNCCSEWE